MGERLKIVDFARRLGVSGPAVHQAIGRGRLRHSVTTDEKGRKWIDVEVGVREWNGNTDARKNVNAGAGGAPRQARDEPTLFDEQAPRGAAPRSDDGKGVSLNDVRKIAEGIKAKTAQLDFDVRRGKLIEVDRVKAEWFRVLREARDRVMLMPSRCAGLCAAESDERRVYEILADECRDALTEISQFNGLPTE